MLYQGECILTKFINPDQVEDVSLQKEKMITLFKVDKGGILGLETINANAKYTTNLLVTRDFTVLYQIRLKFLQDSFVSIGKFLRPMYNTQNELIQSTIQRELFIMGNRKKEIRIHTINKNKSTVNIITKKVVKLINDMAVQRNSSKRTLKISLCQNKINNTPSESYKKYSMFKFPQSNSQYSLRHQKNSKNKVLINLNKSKANLFKDLLFFKSSNKKQDSLLLIAKTNKKYEEKKKKMVKTINMMSGYSHCNYCHRIPFLSYDTGSFDLPLIGQNGGL